MKKKIVSGLLAAAMAFLAAAAPKTANAQEQQALAQAQAENEIEVPKLEEGTYVKGEALVSMSATAAAALAKEGAVSFDKNIKVEECFDFGPSDASSSGRIQDYVALVSSDTYTTEELMEQVSQKFYVDAVAPNSYMHLCGNDAYSDYQWYLDGAGALQTSSIGVDYSGLQVQTRMQPVVAIIDTGVDYLSEELKDSVWVNAYQSKGLKGTYGYDFAENDPDPMDTFGHGTHCAGIIAAKKDNGIGISGISDAKIMALKVAKDGEETIDTAGVVAAFEYIVSAQQLGVPIAAVNCSWGGSRDTGEVLNTLIDKMGENGALTVFAAGNDAVNWDTVAMPLRVTPYDLSSKYVVVVGASNEADGRAYFSDYGNTKVDLFAPGSNILSTVPKAKFMPQLWSKEKREDATVFYDTVTGQENLYKTASDIEGLSSDYTVKLSYEPDIGFTDAANGCLKYTVKYNRKSIFPWSNDNAGDDGGYFDNGKEQAGFFYLDVTSLNLDTSKTYYISCLMAESDGDGMPMWDSVEKVSEKESSRFVTAGDKTYLALTGISTKSTRTAVYYFDDIAVSVADLDASEFEKYDLMSGSSMAAPMATAAIAVLRGANPKLDAAGVQSLLMDCTRSVDSLDNACVTGGILDLSGAAVRATKLKLNKTSASVRLGKTLQLSAKVSPSYVTDAGVTWKSSNAKYASVSQNGKVKVKRAGIGKTVKITAKTTDGTKLKKTCKVKILKAKNKS